jgi:hypothetical protein
MHPFPDAITRGVIHARHRATDKVHMDCPECMNGLSLREHGALVVLARAASGRRLVSVSRQVLADVRLTQAPR